DPRRRRHYLVRVWHPADLVISSTSVHWPGICRERDNPRGDIDLRTAGAAHGKAIVNVSAVIPAFNEARTIADVVLGLQDIVSNIVVVDDGSRDGTEDRARAAGAEVLLHRENRGKGAAIRTGLA